MREKMNRTLRAKQFMPFAALRGYEEALRQKERVILPQVLLGEDAQQDLDRTLRLLRPGDKVTAVYYFQGDFLERTGLVTGIDPDTRLLRIAGTAIPFSALRSLVQEDGS